MRRLLLAALLLAPLASYADECKYEAPRNLTLDLAGVRTVQVDLHSHDLHLVGSDSAKGGAITGRACASDPRLLDDLVITPRREGDRLIIDVGANRNHVSVNFFGQTYADLQINLQLPAQLAVELNVGSGDAWISSLHSLQAKVGSGDVHITRISGPVGLSMNSGDVDVNDVGSLNLGSIGSGDLKVRGVTGDVRIGSMGSGDVTLGDVGGSVRVDTLSSGDLRVRDVNGDFSVGAKGSGDISHSGVRGKVSVPHDRDDD